ncbi:MAG: GerMN domain-containing protein [Spirochaetaceae bacterium]|jgi:hypothetical protein|nr:GerMN domain-containing protein [Spirochaetaceae bacterium]
MADKKPKRKRGAVPRVVLFWSAFILVIALLFIINIPKISKTFETVFGGEKEGAVENTAVQTERARPAGEPAREPSVTFITPESSKDSPRDGESGAITVFPEAPEAPAAPPPEPPPAARQSAGPPPAAEPAELNQRPSGAEPKGAQTDPRARTIYLVKVEGAGTVFLEPVKRLVPVNDTPLVTALNILLAGPTADESRRELISVIPKGTRVLRASVNGSIATIDFNENFMFNNYGEEGYIAQLKQIIWTATEFANINEVQIQIEGRKTEFLGETARIDRPLSRASF